MNKRDLAKAVAVQSDVDLATATKVLDGFTDVVTSVVSKGEPVLMTGFAKFTKVERAARMGRNPATGEQIRIKASKRVRISPAKTLKDVVLSGGSGGPKLARGVWPVDAEAVKRAGRAAPAVVTRSAPAKRAPAKKVAAKRAPAKRAATAKRAPAKKAPAKRAVAKKAPAKRAPAKRAATAKRATAKRATAKRTPAKRSVAKRATRRS
jgi:DNA-binding protein HU-beta